MRDQGWGWAVCRLIGVLTTTMLLAAVPAYDWAAESHPQKPMEDSAKPDGSEGSQSSTESSPPRSSTDLNRAPAGTDVQQPPAKTPLVRGVQHPSNPVETTLGHCGRMLTLAQLVVLGVGVVAGLLSATAAWFGNSFRKNLQEKLKKVEEATDEVQRAKKELEDAKKELDEVKRQAKELLTDETQRSLRQTVGAVEDVLMLSLPDSKERLGALQRLSQKRQPLGAAPMIRILEDQEEELGLRQEAAYGLGRYSEKAVLENLRGPIVECFKRVAQQRPAKEALERAILEAAGKYGQAVGDEIAILFGQSEGTDDSA